MPSSTINNRKNKVLPLVITMGEPAGIGPEIILKSWLEKNKSQLPAFFALGSEQVLKDHARKLGLNLDIEPISSPDEARDIFEKALPVLSLDRECDFTIGRPSVTTTPLVVGAIEKAVQFCFEKKTAGLVTAPIQKSILYEAGFRFPGHTEYLADLCQSQTSKNVQPVMMLATEGLRVVPLTIHLPLKDVMTALTPDLIQESCRIIHSALQQDFGIDRPRIAVAGLNPHAGEDRAMGDEERRIIIPALTALKQQGMDITGPLPADTLFHARARQGYDVALCMYHDQALIPIKTLDFEGGVNITLGLPIIRTSPDHGTALNLAGLGRASPQSMINAIKQAEQIYRYRTGNNV